MTAKSSKVNRIDIHEQAQAHRPRVTAIAYE